LGYHAVGSGETHALLHIIAVNHARTKDINQTVFTVYEAKRHAEVAQGVGKETDMMVITDGNIRTITLEELEQLASIYNQKVSPQLDEVEQSIQKLPFNQ